MEALSTKTLELQPGAKSQLFYGNYAYYLDRTASAQSTGIPSAPAPQDKASANEKRLLDKQKQTQMRKLQRQEEEILKQLEELEKNKAALENELSLPEVYSKGEKAKAVKQRMDQCAAEIEAKTKEWEDMVRELTRISAN
jgi:ATP-binding cassette subfamily F protein 3